MIGDFWRVFLFHESVCRCFDENSSGVNDLIGASVSEQPIVESTVGISIVSTHNPNIIANVESWLCP